MQADTTNSAAVIGPDLRKAALPVPRTIQCPTAKRQSGPRICEKRTERSERSYDDHRALWRG